MKCGSKRLDKRGAEIYAGHKCAGFADLRRVRSITRGAEKLLSWAECWARATEFYEGRACAERLDLPGAQSTTVLREVGFGTFLAGYS